MKTTEGEQRRYRIAEKETKGAEKWKKELPA